MKIYDAKLEWDEDGLHLLIDTDELDALSRRQMQGKWDFRVDDPEGLYDRVKSAILPWLMERDQARGTFRPTVFVCHDVDESGGYAADDPKSPGYHDRMSALADDRDAFEIFTTEDR